jgi:hypothetical protein
METRRKRLEGHVSRIKENRNGYMKLVGYPKGKKPLGRARHRWDGNFYTHGSVHCRLLNRNTNKMQLCNRIYYFKVFLKD